MREGWQRFDTRWRFPGTVHARHVTVVALAGLSLFTATAARAGAWIPAEGHGSVEPMLRISRADRSFPDKSFSTATVPSSKERSDQLRIAGEHGLGHDFAVNYDLRYAFKKSSKTKSGVTTSTDKAGLQDGWIGLNYGFFQSKNLAETAGLEVVFPGTAIDTTSDLSGGQWAVQPIYRFGFKPGFWDLTAKLDAASRLFLDGGAVQFRKHTKVSAPLFLRVNLFGKLFFVRSVRMSGYNSLRDPSELYDLLRVGIGTEFHLTNNIKPVIVYESNIAGMSHHAGDRVTIGVKFSY